MCSRHAEPGAGHPDWNPRPFRVQLKDTADDFAKAFLTLVLIAAAGIAFVIASVGYFPEAVR